MRGTISVRDKGRKLDAIRIRARATEQGQLILEIFAASPEAEALVEHHNSPGVGHLLRITTER